MKWNDEEDFSFSIGLDASFENYIHTNNEDFFCHNTGLEALKRESLF